MRKKKAKIGKTEKEWKKKKKKNMKVKFMRQKLLYRKKKSVFTERS